MRLLAKLIVPIQAFFLTLNPSEHMSPASREKTLRAINDLAKIRGIDTSVSKRREFIRDHLVFVPKAGGVYRIYEGDDLKYIGVSLTNLRKRLRRHLKRAEDPKWLGKRPLYELISGGNTSFEYYITPYPGWVEDHELTSYDRKDELVNKQLRGNKPLQ